MKRARRSVAVVALAAAVTMIGACTPGSGGATPPASAPAAVPAASVAPAASTAPDPYGSAGKGDY